MRRSLVALLASLCAFGSASVLACPDDKGKTKIDGSTVSGQVSTPGTRS